MSTEGSAYTPNAAPQRSALASLTGWMSARPLREFALWTLAAAGLLLFEVFSLLQVYVPSRIAEPGGAFMAVNEAIKWAALSATSAPTVIAFLLLTWRRLPDLAATWARTASGRAWPLWLLANGAILSVMLVASRALNAGGAGAVVWAGYALWCLGATALFATIAAAYAPLPFWREFLRRYFPSVAIALAAGALTNQAMAFSQSLWEVLAGWTLRASTLILSLYEQGVSHSVAERTITADGFSIYIDRSCSGYEGMGLVTAFLSVFIWAFRKEFRFPNILLIIPVGILAIWWLNALRIAALVSIGAHVSPRLAVEGFHSQAGWLAFVAASVSLMLAAYKLRFFRRDADATLSADQGVRLACAHLFPFIALMLGLILTKTFSEDGQSLYPIVVVAVFAAMWPFRDVYRRIAQKPGFTAIAVGAGVGAAWIVTDSGTGASSAVGQWLATAPAWYALLWVSARAVGAAVVAPIAEELAFRGYLHRALIAKRFETVEPRQFTWLAFGVSTLLFAAMHERWLSAALAGAAFALVMYRSNRISDAIVAHIVANAIIAGWAIYWGEWSLL